MQQEDIIENTLEEPVLAYRNDQKDIDPYLFKQMAHSSYGQIAYTSYGQIAHSSFRGKRSDEKSF